MKGTIAMHCEAALKTTASTCCYVALVERSGLALPMYAVKSDVSVVKCGDIFPQQIRPRTYLLTHILKYVVFTNLAAPQRGAKYLALATAAAAELVSAQAASVGLRQPPSASQIYLHQKS